MKPEYDDLITVEEYFTILSKTEELNPEEIFQKKAFEDFIENCEAHSELLSPATESIYAKYKRKLASLAVKDKQTSQEKTLIHDFQSKMEKEETLEETNDYTRKLDKAGYISATVVLVMLLNIGFIIAMAMLGNK